MTVPIEMDDSRAVEPKSLPALSAQIIDVAQVICVGPEPDWEEFEW